MMRMADAALGQGQESLTAASPPRGGEPRARKHCAARDGGRPHPQLPACPNAADPLNGEAATLMLRDPEKHSLSLSCDDLVKF